MTSKTKALKRDNCHDCKVAPGEFHKPGCDTERCPYCGGQILSCNCMEDKDRTAWIDKNLLPWTGVFPGQEEAAELGLWCKWLPNERFEVDKKRVGLREALSRLGAAPPGRWAVCDKDDPEARPDLNRLHVVAVWDRKQRRFVKRSDGKSV